MLIQLLTNRCTAGFEKTHSARLDPVHHPVETDQGELILGVAATDIGVHASKPDLFNLRPLCRVSALFPERRVKGLALIVDCQGVKPMLHMSGGGAIQKLNHRHILAKKTNPGQLL